MDKLVQNFFKNYNNFINIRLLKIKRKNIYLFYY